MAHRDIPDAVRDALFVKMRPWPELRDLLAKAPDPEKLRREIVKRRVRRAVPSIGKYYKERRQWISWADAVERWPGNELFSYEDLTACDQFSEVFLQADMKYNR